MKYVAIIIWTALFLTQAWSADMISVDEFKKIKDPDKQWMAIQNAPPEQRSLSRGPDESCEPMNANAKRGKLGVTHEGH